MSPRRHLPLVGVGILALATIGPGCSGLSVGAGPLSAHWWQQRHLLRGQVESDGALAGPSGPMVVYAIPVSGHAGGGPSSSTLLVTDDGIESPFLVVPAGQQIRFHNKGDIVHRFFCTSDENGFELELLQPGETRSLPLQRPGVVQIYCKLHASKQSTVLVVPTTHFTVVGPDGDFSLGGLPGGSYLVETWCEGQPSRRVEWQVPSPAPLRIGAAEPPLQGSR